MNKNNNSISRRNFLQQGSIMGSGLLVTANMPAWAALLKSKENKTGPTTKNLGIDNMQSLYERGTITTYLKSKNELKYIGMPVSGIHTGGLYLSGDGRLWLWDIFNLNQEGMNPVDVVWKDPSNVVRTLPSRGGGSYVAPPRSEEVRPLEQGFAIQFEFEGKTIVRQLQESDWDEIAFEATYPVATITYTDKELPVQVIMQAYSPFIPLDVDRSGIPATIFTIEIKNTSNTTFKVKLAGWLENKTGLYTALINRAERNNQVFKEDLITGVNFTLEKTALGNQSFDKSFDYGTLCIAALDSKAIANADLGEVNNKNLFSDITQSEALKAAQQKLIANVVSTATIEANTSTSISYIISWHSPNLSIDNNSVLPKADSGRYYDNRFKNAKEVVEYVATNFKELAQHTILWKNTWYDSTLPYWFLDRTFINIGALATTTSHRFKSGRYWAWEGVGACEGNCTHVWHYAQAIGRIFPAMERDNRERVDLGISLQSDGGIWFRGEYAKAPAIDGQAGRVLGCYREHQMSENSIFLNKNWSKIKSAVQFIINQDRNGDGMEDTPLENTLDAVWDGEISWIVGLCIAAVKAGQMMAEEMNDSAFAAVCKEYVTKGMKNMSEQLFNGEYFIHKPDPVKGRTNLGSYNTCHIDQVLGQSWACQVGLGRVIDKKQTRSALQSLWKYNFIKDMGVYAETHKGGRPYAVYGESGLVMNTNPKNEPKPYGDNASWQMGYFNECMTGFEHQVASHMMAEGMIDEALMITKAIHDRYHASKRNPFNEIECSDHYGRAMSSYGTFVTACGFEYHGPKGHIGFAPKLSPENFKAPFTAAEGWGSYEQQYKAEGLRALYTLRFGKLKLSSIGISLKKDKPQNHIIAHLNNEKISCSYTQDKDCITILFKNMLTLEQGDALEIKVG